MFGAQRHLVRTRAITHPLVLASGQSCFKNVRHGGVFKKLSIVNCRSCQMIPLKYQKIIDLVFNVHEGLF